MCQKTLLKSSYEWINLLDEGVQLNKKSRGREKTPNVEAIGMLIRIFSLENHKKYPNFDFKPLKYPDHWHNTIKNTVFPICLQKDMLNKNPGKKSFS